MARHYKAVKIVNSSLQSRCTSAQINKYGLILISFRMEISVTCLAITKQVPPFPYVGTTLCVVIGHINLLEALTDLCSCPEEREFIHTFSQSSNTVCANQALFLLSHSNTEGVQEAGPTVRFDCQESSHNSPGPKGFSCHNITIFQEPVGLEVMAGKAL